jgi:hypothetical protein
VAYKQFFFVQAFGVDRKNRVIGGRSYAVPDEVAARLKAKRLAETAAGVVAFSQMVDAESQDAEDPVLLLAIGRVPPEAREEAA